jgi:hypothetical protein
MPKKQTLNDRLVEQLGRKQPKDVDIEDADREGAGFAELDDADYGEMPVQPSRFAAT